MKSLISLMIMASLSLGIYMYFLKQAAPGPGMVVTQQIDLTGVQNDLVAIAQAERMYYVQNGNYVDLQTLATTGTMNIARTSRGGYTYTVEPQGENFTVTATYTAPPIEVPKGVTPPHWPTMTIDQTMEVHQVD
jgi:hypothetical protein